MGLIVKKKIAESEFMVGPVAFGVGNSSIFGGLGCREKEF